MPVLLKISSILILQIGGALGSSCSAAADGSSTCASIQDLSSPSSAVLMQREHQIVLPQQTELHAVPATGHRVIQVPQVQVPQVVRTLPAAKAPQVVRTLPAAKAPVFKLYATAPAQPLTVQAPVDGTGTSAQAPLATTGTSAQAPLNGAAADVDVSNGESTVNNQVVTANLPADTAGTLTANAPLPQQQTGVAPGAMPMNSGVSTSEEKPQATNLAKKATKSIKASKPKEQKETKKEDEDSNSWSSWLLGGSDKSSSDKGDSDKSSSDSSDSSGSAKKQSSSKKQNSMPQTDYEKLEVGVAPGTAVSPSNNQISQYSGAAGTGATATTAQTVPQVQTVITPVAANSAPVSSSPVVRQAAPIVSSPGAVQTVVAPANAPVAGTRKILVPSSSDKQLVGASNQTSTGASKVVSTNGTTGPLKKVITPNTPVVGNVKSTSLKTSSGKKQTAAPGTKVPEGLTVDNQDFIDDQLKKAKKTKAKKSMKSKHSTDNDDDEYEDDDEDEDEEDLSGKRAFVSAYEDKQVPLSNLGYKKILQLDEEGELRHFVGRVVRSMGLAAESSQTLSDVANMRSGSSFSGLVSDILKSKQKGSITSTCLRKHGDTAPMTENGYRGVVQMHSDNEMSTFMKRVAEGMGLQVLSNGPLQGAAQFYSGTEGIQSLKDLEDELKLACNREDTWVRKVGVVKAQEDMSSMAAPSVAADAPIAAAASSAGFAAYAEPTVLPPLDPAGADSLAAQAAGAAPIAPAADPLAAPAADPYAPPVAAPAVAPVATDPSVNAVAAPATEAAAAPLDPSVAVPAPAPYNADVAMAVAPAGAAPVAPAVTPEAAAPPAAAAVAAPATAMAAQPAATAAAPGAAADPAANADTDLGTATPGPGILDNLQ